MGEETYLRSLLRSYYEKVQVNSVPDIAFREFGYGEFGQKISARHLSFKSNSELNSFLSERAPFYISYSNARYELPAARPMEKKNLLGADLIYEFDADDIKTDCKQVHDSWACRSCQACGRGNIKECSKCGSGTVVDEWICSECLNETKRQTKNLLAVLQDDFGFSSGIFVNFSGSKGFHTHVRPQSVQSLSKSARLELLDYITATNLNLEAMGFSFPAKGPGRCPLAASARGWSKKLLDLSKGALEGMQADHIAVLGSISLPAAEKLLKEKHTIINGMQRGVLGAASGVRADKFWKPFLTSLVLEQKLEVDRQTSVDINKIIRVPNTIHGSTGLVAKEISIPELAGFDPFKDAVVFSQNEVALANVNSPKFSLSGQVFGPFKGESASLPEFAAFYLLARGSARMVGK
ncbi:MAG TPA: DNA primase small subunit domain-containing protein [archaeon]|nr:DNA primase small subunit domain-containing protein [archaeon]